MLSSICLHALFISSIVNVYGDSTAYTFLALGDWGGAALGGQYTKNVYDVANQLILSAKQLQPNFVINTGDNIYWCGIKNTSDFQIVADFEEPYKDESLELKWYTVLGNHEYGYNVDAQIDYSKFSTRWHLPSRYYSERIQLDSSNYLSMIFLDTSPCIADYRNSNQKYWDPCSTTYPTCSLQSTDDDFEGPCEFNQNILSQDCSAQYQWLQTALAAVPSNDWLVVVGHHPIDEVDVLDMTSLIQARGFSLYLNGHSHALTHYTIDKSGAYVTSGAGALVNTVDQLHPITFAKVNGLDIIANGTLRSTTGHSYQTVYNQKVAGFTSHTFSSDFSSLTTNFITYQGQIVHTFKVNKAGTVIN